MATIPTRVNAEVSNDVPSISSPLPRKFKNGIRIVDHLLLGTSKDALYDVYGLGHAVVLRLESAK